MTILYLSWTPRATPTLVKHAEDRPVKLLVAYPELKKFMAVREQFNIQSWFLDSGAFSVMNSGKKICLDEYIAVVKDTDADEVAGLDVIGDANKTRKNVERMLDSGLCVIPTFHYGTEWSELDWICNISKKIAIGGMARVGLARDKWIQQVFNKVYPKPIHGFGVTSRNILMKVPFHSVDSTTWQIGPCGFGSWAGLSSDGRRIKTGGAAPSSVDLWAEVEAVRILEKEVKHRWRMEIPKLEKMLA